METKNSHINRAMLLFFILFLASSIYVVSLLDNIQYKIDNTDENFELVYNELENHRNDISNIYNMIDSLEETSEVVKGEEYHDFYDYNIHKDMRDLYYGRLYISKFDISVGLYRGNDQFITDREDSANIIDKFNGSEILIADHSNQEFSKLFAVKVGTKGYINTRYLERIHVECVNTFNGYNTGTGIVDGDGKPIIGRADYLMYTCRNDSGGVFITLWNVIGTDKE